MVTTICIIQARTGSTRLPGKVMYPLDGRAVLAHVVERVTNATTVDTTIVATSTEQPDDVIEQYAPQFGAEVVRGSEANVLSRFERAVAEYDPDILVRVTADCPLLSPETLNTVVTKLDEQGADYCSNVLERTFPRGLDVEAFCAESFSTVCDEVTEPHHREHVTPYYHEQEEIFERVSVTSEEVFDEEWIHNRTDLRLTLDEPADYQLLETVYRELEYEGILDIRDAIRYIDENELTGINQHVEQNPCDGDSTKS